MVKKKEIISWILLGILVGVITRLSDFFDQDHFLSLSSISTLFGFWIVSITMITIKSHSRKQAFIHTFLYMFSMTCSYYGLKYVLGFFISFYVAQEVYYCIFIKIIDGIQI